MNILFLNFPIDSNQVHALSLPTYFSKLGFHSYLAFEKQHRNFFCNVLPDKTIPLMKEELFDIKYDMIVGKSDAFTPGRYDRRFFMKSNDAFKINLTTMGIDRNKKGTHHCFRGDQLLKPPVIEMTKVYENYLRHEERENTIFIPASIGGCKNQLEFINLVEPSLIRDFRILFAGPVYSKTYFNKMVTRMKDKGIKYEYMGHLSKEEVAKTMKRSKIISLTTDPRPLQPFDWSPRVIPESVCAGTPFFINNLVLFPPIFKEFGFVYKSGNVESFNSILAKMLDADLNKIGFAAFTLGTKKLTMEYACKTAYEDILIAYEEYMKQ